MARSDDGRRPKVGHGQMLKALNALPGCTDRRFRVAAMYLAHAKPPDFSVYVGTKAIAQLVGGCSTRTVERCRRWLIDQDAIEIEGGGGRSRFTRVDFAPLAWRINRDYMESQFHGETATAKAKTATGIARNYDKNRRRIREGLRKDLPKGPADAHAVNGAHAAPEAMAWPECVQQLELDFPEQDLNIWIRPLQAVHEGSLLILLAPNAYIVNWIREHCLNRISEWWRAQGYKDGRVALEIGSRSIGTAT